MVCVVFVISGFRREIDAVRLGGLKEHINMKSLVLDHDFFFRSFDHELHNEK